MNKKNIAVWVLIIALSVAGLRLCLGVESPNKPAESSKQEFSWNKSGSVLENKGPERSDTRSLFYRMMVSVFAVVILGGIAIYFSKRFGPRITNLAGRKIHVIETVRLGSNKTLHLVEVEGRTILIGAANDNITKLLEIDADSKPRVSVLSDKGDK